MRKKSPLHEMPIQSKLQMIHVERILLSFLVAWSSSLLGLFVVFHSQKPVENYYSADPSGDMIRAMLLFGFVSFLCIGVAWLLIAIPYYVAILRHCTRKSLMLHSLVAGFAGFLFMMIATQLLPVDGKSWTLTAPIAFVAGFLGAMMTRHDLLFPKSSKKSRTR